MYSCCRALLISGCMRFTYAYNLAERQWALILVAGGDEAYNYWDTLEETVKDRKKVDQVRDAFEKSFKQSTSFWHFRDTYLADFRQDESEDNG